MVRLLKFLRDTTADDWAQLLAAGLGITPSPKNCIRASKSTTSIMSGNGLYKLKNSEDDMDRVGGLE